MINNPRTKINQVLLGLTGSKSLVKLWWKSPNKGLRGQVPDTLWKQRKHLWVMLYVMSIAQTGGS